MLMMIGSGWQIYDASPLFPFEFPSVITLGVSYSGQYGKRATDSAFKGHLDVSFW